MSGIVEGRGQHLTIKSVKGNHTISINHQRVNKREYDAVLTVRVEGNGLGEKLYLSKLDLISLKNHLENLIKYM